MKVKKLNEMTKGWFIGNFEPSIIKTNDVEVAVKKYSAGDKEDSHFHKIATEITVIVSGTVKMNGAFYESGDIIIIEPGDITDFEAITDVVNTVVKYPGSNNDKYSL
jgi:mannose-6-phosphate isomerase-like protein (cupin superfamily)